MHHELTEDLSYAVKEKLDAVTTYLRNNWQYMHFAEKNLESRASLRAIIADGRWAAFSADYIPQFLILFQRELLGRIQLAVQQGRLCSDLVQQLVK